MPFVRMALRAGTTPEYRRTIADGVHQAMLDSIAIPAGDRFQVITEHSADDLIYDPSYLDVKRSDKIVFRAGLCDYLEPISRRTESRWNQALLDVPHQRWLSGIPA